MLIMSACAIGCTVKNGNTGEGGAGQAGSIDRLVIGTQATLNTFAIGDMGVYYSRNTMSIESLVGQYPNGSWAPRLADSWETSDSKTWTFHLNTTAKWHDGVDFTASDVNFTMRYTMEKQIWIQDSMFLYDVESVSTPDNDTIIITLKSPDSNLLSNVKIGLKVLPEHVFGKVDDPMKYVEADATIGTGPYVFKSLDKDAGILRYTANEDYYRGRPVIGEIEFKFYSNADTMMMALENGEIDTTFAWGSGIDYYYVPRVLKNDDLRVMTTESGGLRALSFNTQKSPFDNASMRIALSYTIDYEELMRLNTGGYGNVSNAGLIPSCIPNYKETRELQRNLTLAKAMLDGMGYVDVDGDGFREAPDGSKFQPALISSSSASWARQAELMKKYLNEAGIDVQVRLVSSNWRQEQLKRQYDMMLGGTSIAGTYAYAGYGTTIIDSKGGLGNSNVNDPELTAIIGQVKNATTDDEQRQAAYELQDYYADEMPAIALYWFDIIQPYNKKYAGYQFDPWFGILSYETFFGLEKAG